MRIVHFVADAEGTRAAQASDALGLNRSTCHCILKTLVAGGWLTFDEQSKEYRLGAGLVALAARPRAQPAYVATAHPFLERWTALTRFTSLLMMPPVPLAPTQLVVVDKVDSPRPVLVTVAHGQRFPIVTAGMGKAYLSMLDEDEARRLIGLHGLPAYTRCSITDEDSYVAQLRQARERSWAASRGEYYGGCNAVAAPVRDPAGRVSCVVAGMGAEPEMRAEDLDQYGASIRATANDIERALAAAG